MGRKELPLNSNKKKKPAHVYLPGNYLCNTAHSGPGRETYHDWILTSQLLVYFLPISRIVWNIFKQQVSMSDS